MTRLSDLQYGVNDVPPWYLTIMLGFQHYLTMFGATLANAVIVMPFMCVESDVSRSEIISTMFFVSGIVTLLQTTLGIRLPIIQGGTFALIGPLVALMSLEQWQCPATQDAMNQTEAENQSDVTTTSPEVSNEEIWQPRMREVQGAIIFASLVQIVIGMTGLIGLMLRFIGPLTIAPTIALIGLALFKATTSFCSEHWGIACLTIALIVIFSQYLRNIELPCAAYDRGKGCRAQRFPLFKLFPVILGISLSWLVCYILTVTNVFPSDPNANGYQARTDTNIDVLYEAKWFRFPYPGQWGLPTYSVAGVLGMIAGVFAGILESIGDYYACARLSGAPPPPVHAINRAVFIEGIGTLLAGCFGTGSGTTSYSENIGAIGITKCVLSPEYSGKPKSISYLLVPCRHWSIRHLQVASRRVSQASGVILVLLGMLGKFGALFVTIPAPVVGGVFMVMFGMIVAVGISNLQFVDLNSSRNLFVFGFSLFFGLSVPDWISNNREIIATGVDTLDEIIFVLLTTSMFVGGFLGFFLDNTIPGTREERGLTVWSQQQQSTDGDAEDDIASYYDLPWGCGGCMEKCSCTRYIPICPTFRGWSCRKTEPRNDPGVTNGAYTEKDHTIDPSPNNDISTQL